jgi:signal transduction histidine kinase
VAGFRGKLVVSMMVLISTITAGALYFSERNLTAGIEADLQRGFRDALATLQTARDLRQAALVERCRTLERRPRIHAVLEDAPTLDDLYVDADVELHDLLQPADRSAEREPHALQAEFYRFLDRKGAVIAAPPDRAVGRLAPGEEAQLALRGAPDRPQVGYIWRNDGAAGENVYEIIVQPIVSTESGEVIAALALGLKPFEFANVPAAAELRSGVWVDGRLDLAGTPLPAELTGAVARVVGSPELADRPVPMEIAGEPHLLFYKRLNPGSRFPPAFEVCIFPLAELRVRQRQLRWQVVGAGALLLLGALVASHFLAGRLSVPVEKLAVDSEENRAQRLRAEAALELTSEELQRSARFSADASHQLKTPVTVLRAGLEELLARDNLTPDECDQVSALIHQTYRLSSLIEDLLLLSRMDAGRLQLEFSPVNLSQLIEGALDDLSALPDELGLKVETDFPAGLLIAGEKRYTAIILQNLLENARKYNHRGGTIRISARTDGDRAVLAVANTGRPIPAAVQARIFERFHRGPIGENVPGYGLGLNLARELARLHRGDLRLARSDDAWTVFEVQFELAAASRSKPDR